VAMSREAVLRRLAARDPTVLDAPAPASDANGPDMTTDDRRLSARLYWNDGRVEDLKQPLDATAQPHITRNPTWPLATSSSTSRASGSTPRLAAAQ
jgi:hypothetical protein